MSSSKTFNFKSTNVNIDDTKITITKGNKINKEKQIIFLDKVEYLGLISTRDLRLLLWGIGLILSQVVYYYFSFEFLDMINWGFGVIGLLLIIIFYYLQENNLEIRTAGTKIATKYDEELLNYTINKIEELKDDSFEF